MVFHSDDVPPSLRDLVVRIFQIEDSPNPKAFCIMSAVGVVVIQRDEDAVPFRVVLHKQTDGIDFEGRMNHLQFQVLPCVEGI